MDVNIQRKINDFVQDKSAQEITKEQEQRLQKNQYTVKRTDNDDYNDKVSKTADVTGNYLQNNVRTAIINSLGRSRYAAIDELNIQKPGEEETLDIALHHSTGSKLALEGQDVIEFNITGSRREKYSMPHKNLTGQDGKDNPAEIEKVFGKDLKEKAAGKKLGHLRKKSYINDKGAVKTRFTIAGADLSGIGKYSEDNIEKYILELGRSILISKFNEWDFLEDDELKEAKPLNIMLRGHSRGGVSVALGAMRIKRWIADNYPRFLDKVRFDLIQYDPVPGSTEHIRKNSEIDMDPIDKALSTKDPRYMSLGESANTTVFYSMHTNKSEMLSPQGVLNPSRIILSMADHGSNLGVVDDSQKDPARITYFAEKNGKVEAFRSSGLGELDKGVYIQDDRHNLIRIKSLREYDDIAAQLLKGGHLQAERHKILRKSVESWFKTYGDDRVEGTKKEQQRKKQEEEKRKEEQKRAQESAENQEILDELLPEIRVKRVFDIPYELIPVREEKKKLDEMPRNTTKQERAYAKKLKKYLAFKKNAQKSYIKKIASKRGSYIGKLRKGYLDTLVELSYLMELDGYGLLDAVGQEKTDQLLEEIKNHPCSQDHDLFIPEYLKNNLQAGSWSTIRSLLNLKDGDNKVYDRAKLLEKLENKKLHEPAEAKIEEKSKEKKEQQNEHKAEENKDKQENNVDWDKHVSELFYDTFKVIRDYSFDKGDDEIWKNLSKLGNDDSVYYKQFRFAVMRVKKMAQRLGYKDDRNGYPSAKELMKAIAALSETANAYYDMHRGHQFSEQGKRRRKACDMVRQLTWDFYDRLDLQTGGTGFGNRAVYTVPVRSISISDAEYSKKKMEEFAANYSRWKVRFANQELFDLPKIRDRNRLFAAYEREMHIYRNSWKRNSWPKEIADVIREADYYRLQTKVHKKFEEKNGKLSDPLEELIRKHVKKVENRNRLEKQPGKDVDAGLTRDQEREIERVDQWFVRNFNNAGLFGRMLGIANRHGWIVPELLQKPKRERLFIYYLLETGKRKSPELFDLYTSQGYTPDVKKIRKQMLATKLKLISYCTGGYTYMGKLTEAMKANDEYRNILQDCANVDLEKKNADDKNAQQIEPEQKRMAALRQALKSTQDYKNQKELIDKLGKKAPTSEKNKLDDLQKKFISDMQELIKADNAMEDELKYHDINESGKKAPDKLYSVKNSNAADANDNSNTAVMAGSAPLGFIPAVFGLGSNSLITGQLNLASNSIGALEGVLGLLFGLYDVSANNRNMHTGDIVARIAEIMNSATKFAKSLSTAADYGKQMGNLAEDAIYSASSKTRILGLITGAVDVAINVYQTIKGTFDTKNANKAHKLLKNKFRENYKKKLRMLLLSDKERQKLMKDETPQEREQREKEERQAQFEKNMIKLAGDVSGKKMKSAGFNAVVSTMKLTGLVIPGFGMLVSGVGSVLGIVTTVTGIMEQSEIRKKMFDNYFKFEELMDDAKEIMEKTGQKVADMGAFEENMRSEIAAAAGFADIVTACDQISKRYADNICKGLFGSDDERVEGDTRRAYINFVKSFGLDYDEKKKIPDADALARKMNGK